MDAPRELPTDRGFWPVLRAALGGAHFDYTKGSLDRAVVMLAVPMVLEMAMESAFVIVDIYFVGKLGPAAVATVGLTEAMLTIFYALAIGLSMATTATVARRVGENDLDGAAAAGAQGIYAGVVVSILLGIPCAIYAPELLALMGAAPDVVATGAGYTAVMLGVNIVLMLLFLDNAIFRGAGDAVVAMRSLWLANGINIVLDPCLIFGLGPFPELGVTGAAVATVCGRGTGVVYQLVALHRGRSRIRLHGDALRLRPAVMLRLLRLSVGNTLQFLIATTSWVALMRIMSRFGEQAVAGYTIAIRIVMFTLLPSWGISNAAATLVGQNLGARQPDRAARAVWRTGLYNMAFLLLVMVLFLSLAPDLVGFFTDDETVRAVGVQSLRILSCGYLFYGWGMVLTQAFNGAGDTITPTWINLGCFWMLQIPLAWGLTTATDLGAAGVFWAVAIAESLLAAVAAVLFRRGRWQTRTV
jgi:putative MATE family efflux protein